MYPSSDVPWVKIHEFLLDIGSVRDPKELCVRAIQKIHLLIPYDQARLYFVSETGKIHDQYLVGVEQVWSDLYLEYYSKVENGRYSIPYRIEHYARAEEDRYVVPPGIVGFRAIPRIQGAVYDWMNCGRDQFIMEYIRPQGLKHSAGFSLHDADGLTRCVFCIDRTDRWGYSQREIDIMCIIQPHLDNLHRNLFVLSSPSTQVPKAEVEAVLTRRELQIARLLCKGMTPAQISQTLILSQATVYRHIANIHAKLGVSNRQELLLKLMGSVESGEERDPRKRSASREAVVRTNS